MIKDSTSIKVTLVDNRSFDAELRGAEPDKDLAVLRIKSPPNLTPVLVGSSSGLQVRLGCSTAPVTDGHSQWHHAAVERF